MGTKKDSTWKKKKNIVVLINNNGWLLKVWDILVLWDNDFFVWKPKIIESVTIWQVSQQKKEFPNVLFHGIFFSFFFFVISLSHTMTTIVILMNKQAEWSWIVWKEGGIPAVRTCLAWFLYTCVCAGYLERSSIYWKKNRRCHHNDTCATTEYLHQNRQLCF